MDTFFIIRIIFLIAGTIFIAAFSWRALFNLKNHGFYRFFLFEANLLLIFFNVPYWFRNPVSPIQIASWMILILSIIFAYQSFYLIRKIGGSRKREAVKENYNFENTVNLVQIGLYKYIRHPMYGSLLLLGLGAFLKDISWMSSILLAIILISITLTAKTEEKENISFFGDSYAEYMKKTKMFFPYLF